MDEVTTALTAHHDLLESYCTLFYRDPHDRDELAQLVRIRVWRGLVRFDGRAEFSTWLYQIVCNTACTEYERRARRAVPVDLQGWSGRESAPCPAPGPEQTVVGRDALARALSTVDERFRHTVELIDVWGCRQEEVARLTGVVETTVRTRLHRGRRHLRSVLSADVA